MALSALRMSVMARNFILKSKDVDIAAEEFVQIKAQIEGVIVVW